MFHLGRSPVPALTFVSRDQRVIHPQEKEAKKDEEYICCGNSIILTCWLLRPADKHEHDQRGYDQTGSYPAPWRAGKRQNRKRLLISLLQNPRSRLWPGQEPLHLCFLRG